MIIPEIKHILYTTDLSENARHAFSYAVSLANRYQAKITIFHVVEELPPSASSLLAGYIDEDELERIKRSNEETVINTVKTRLENFCKEVSVPCPDIEIVIKRGDAVEQILLKVQSSDFDVIVMGTHGHGLFEEAMMGSTARRVVRRSEKPVLVVRLPKDQK
jgi:nucleotide-binding universal stress UspA family protein